VTEWASWLPRRVLIDADYGADGIWWVPSKEELELESPPPGHLGHEQRRSWPPSQELRDDLKAWNQSWEASDGFWESAEARRAWQEQGRELAIRAQNELGTDDWEVFYNLGGRVHRVHPPGSWPAATWEQELLGYPSRERDRHPR
jgi:hypothetical protein